MKIQFLSMFLYLFAIFFEFERNTFKLPFFTNHPSLVELKLRLIDAEKDIQQHRQELIERNNIDHEKKDMWND